MNKILWVKVWGIAIMHGVITLTWVIYNLYLVQLLTQFGFREELGVSLLIIENLLAAFIEPIFGFFSDRKDQLTGTRIPLISLGVLGSSFFFVLMPILAIFGNEQPLWRWFILIVMIVWSAVMAIFHAPVIALLNKCSPKDQLPAANSLVTLFQGVLGAFRFDAYGIILNLGVGFTFVFSSIILIAAGAFLRWLNPPQFSFQGLNSFNAQSGSLTQLFPAMNLRSKLIFIFVWGVSMGWTLRFLLPAVSKIIANPLGEPNAKLGMTFFLVTLGIFALPAGKIATKFNNYLTLLIGYGITIVTINLLNQIQQPQFIFFLTVCLVAGFSFVLNGIIPCVLNAIAGEDAGLGIGTYFGGFSAGLSLFDFIFMQLDKPSQNLGVVATSYALIFGMICILIIQDNAEQY